MTKRWAMGYSASSPLQLPPMLWSGEYTHFSRQVHGSTLGAIRSRFEQDCLSLPVALQKWKLVCCCSSALAGCVTIDIWSTHYFSLFGSMCSFFLLFVEAKWSTCVHHVPIVPANARFTILCSIGRGSRIAEWEKIWTKIPSTAAPWNRFSSNFISTRSVNFFFARRDFYSDYRM